jgi:thioredoxin reductase (NADPH)
MTDVQNVVIIGSGPAGLTAALYTARANLSPLVIEGLEAGGQLMMTTAVENFPGFQDGIMGPDLMANIRAQAERFGATTRRGNVTAVDLSSAPFAVTYEEGVVRARSVIVSTGASARLLGLPSERALMGHGVSTCATCDGFFFRGKPVAVIGGGNTAVEEALYLSKMTSGVTLIHRRDQLRAEKVLQDRLFANDKISVVWDQVLDEVLGEGQPPAVTGIRTRHVASGALQEHPVEGVFIAIGHDPATLLVRGQLEMDAEGYVITAPDSTATSVPGVFAAGDVQDKTYRQAVTAAGTGCMAALEAEKFLAEHAVARAPARLGATG